jgi:hypothetical protein
MSRMAWRTWREVFTAEEGAASAGCASGGAKRGLRWFMTRWRDLAKRGAHATGRSVST